jgi:hypothetical protein
LKIIMYLVVSPNEIQIFKQFLSLENIYLYLFFLIAIIIQMINCNLKA